MKISYVEKLEDKRWDKKRLSILKRDNYKCKMCGASKSKTLCVHHRYYIYNANPWEYSSDALITLCSDCHELVHKTIKPMVYIITNDIFDVMDFTPCSRCGGRGKFPEYEYVHGGICFRCEGARFEELINQDIERITITDFISSSKKCFDLNNRTLDESGCKRIHSEAKNCQFGMNGFPYDMDMAKMKFRESALNGYGNSQNNLGLILKMENPNVCNMEAFRWFVYAAMQGVAEAQRNVSSMLKIMPGIDEKVVREWEEITKLNQTENEKIKKMIDLAYIFSNANDDALKSFLIKFKKANGC